MKPLLLALLTVLCLLPAHAASLKLDGDLTWEITEPRCTFHLAGGIQNLSPSGSTSGTIKLVLLASSAPFPSRGVAVAEYTLGQIGGGFQFSDFTVVTGSDIPNVSGEVWFTVLVEEFTGSIFTARLAAPSDKRTLLKGDFLDQAKWRYPAGPVIAAPAALAKGARLTLTVRATSELNLLPLDSQTATEFWVRKNSRVRLKGPDGKRFASFTYKTGKSKVAGVRAPHGKLKLTLPATTKFPASGRKVTCYFQTADSGIYKSVEKRVDFKEVLWGTFTLR